VQKSLTLSPSITELVNETAADFRSMALSYDGYDSLTGIFDDNGNTKGVLFDAVNRPNCFSCKAKGDVLDFIQRQENLTFSNGVARLSEIAGASPVPTERSDPPKDPERRSRYEVRFAGGLTRPQLLARVAEHYKKALSASPKAHAYLESRGFEDKEMWDVFDLGAPGSDRSWGLERQGP
jgi:YD repeat-containing protein